MKKLLILTVIALLVAAKWPKPSLAFEEADATATLTSHTSVKDSRADRLEAYLASHNSPLSLEANSFVAEADRLHLDWRLVAAIAGVESTFGKHIPTGSFNAWGWGVFTGQQSGVYFKDWADGITQVSEGLAQNYFAKGAKTIYDVGWIYAANGISWGNHVQFFLDQIEQFAPSHPAQLDITI